MTTTFDAAALASKHGLNMKYAVVIGGEVVEHEQVYGPAIDALTEAHAAGLAQGRAEGPSGKMREGRAYTLDQIATSKAITAFKAARLKYNEVAAIQEALKTYLTLSIPSDPGFAAGLRRAADIARNGWSNETTLAQQATAELIARSILLAVEIEAELKEPK